MRTFIYKYCILVVLVPRIQIGSGCPQSIIEYDILMFKDWKFLVWFYLKKYFVCCLWIYLWLYWYFSGDVSNQFGAKDTAISRERWLVIWIFDVAIKCGHAKIISGRIPTLQVNLFQKPSFLHQLTHNMTKGCSLNSPKNTSSEHVVYKYCFECQNKNKKTIFVHIMFCPCIFRVIQWTSSCNIDARMRASEKDLPVSVNRFRFELQMAFKI